MDYGALYNEEYYKTSCGEISYLRADMWMPFYENVADRIIESLHPTTVLDVGCAVGYLVAALRDRGVEAYGIDASEFAISKVREDIKPFCRVCSVLDDLPYDLPKKYDLVITIEVAEHLYEEDSRRFIDNICKYSDQIIFSSTPDDFSEKTHFNVQQLEYWAKRFAENGFTRSLIYDASYISRQAVKFEKSRYSLANIVENYERSLRIAKSKIKPEDKSISTLYFDIGHGYTDDLVIRLENAICKGQLNVFNKEFDLPEGVKAIRFDLIKGAVCVAKNIEVISDCHTLEWNAVDAVFVDEYVIFTNTDPKLLIDLNGKPASWVKIRADVYVFSSIEVITLLGKFEVIPILHQQIAQQEDEVNNLKLLLMDQKNENQDLHDQLMKCEQEKHELHDQLMKCDQVKHELQDQLMKCEQERLEVHKQLMQYEQDEHELREQLIHCEQEKHELYEQLTQCEQEKQEKETIYEETVNSLKNECTVLKDRIELLGAALWGEEQKVKALSEDKATLDLIYSSRGYKLLSKYYRIRTIMLPRGSKRFIVAKMIFNLPRYIKMGYVKKTFHYIFKNGPKGLKSKIKKVVTPDQLANSYQTQAVIAGSADAQKITPVSAPKSIPKHYESVDIIICVHNAYEDVKRCIESVFEYTTEPFSIIIVDDGSEPQTRDYLRSLVQYSTNIKLIRNEKGNGYTVAANMGLKASEAEYCVLLNSDTIVTAGWVDKMINCMKSNENIGIVGPLSNTASWQSVPQLFGPDGDWSQNLIPEGFSVEDVGRLIEKYSPQIYVHVPLLNGFCLMIHRKVINSIGLFDEENFGKGYGEEDDYNLRAYKAGFGLAIADDTYIYHAQSKSYSNEKRLELCRVSGERLRKKHGDQLLDECIIMVRNNLILEGIRNRAAVMYERETLIRNANKNYEGKRMLIILPIADAGGGGNVVIQEASLMMDMGVDVWLFNLAELKPYFEASHPNLRIPVIYGNRLDSFIDEAKNFDVICATLYTSVKYFKTIRDRYKTRLAYYVQDFEPYFFAKGTKEYDEAFASYTAVEDMKLITKTTWNRNKVKDETGSDCRVIGPSVNIDLFCPRKQFSRTDKVIITAMVRPESPRREPLLTMEVLYEVAKQNADKVEILVFGSDPEKSPVDREFWNGISMDFEYKNLGKLSNIEMASLLSNADIFADFSSFQAMGLTALEAMACACAVIVPRNGGTEEYAKNNVNSLVIDTSNKQECIDALNLLIRDDTLRNKLSVKALEDACQFYPEKSAYKFLQNVFDYE